MSVIIIIVLLLVSIVIIGKGADLLTDSLIPVAHQLGTSYIAVTTLLASFMMSTPELLSSVYSYFSGHPSIGVGVLMGSVMINIGITVGLSASIKPLRVEKDVVIRDGIFLIVVAIIVMILGSDLHYQRTEGAVLLLLFIPYSLNVWFFEKSRSHATRQEKVDNIKQTLDLFGEQFNFLQLKPSLLTFILGAAVLIGGSYIFSYSLVELGKVLSLPDFIIGFVFGAIGTGTPNIAAALQGTLKGYKDVAITETFGSNIFTLLVTLGTFIIITPLTITAKIFYFDMTWMIMIHIIMLAFIIKGYRYKEESLTRYEGAILIAFYIILVILNVILFN